MPNADEVIIWSADVPDEETMMGCLDRLPHLKAIKVDRLFLTGTDHSVIDRLNDRGLLVFDDAKIIEIPSKLAAIAEKHLKHRPWMLNCMAGAISNGVYSEAEQLDGLMQFADACHSVGTRPCGVTVLTSKSAEVVREEFNGRSSVDQVLYYVEQLLIAGFTDVVCSTEEVAAIRSESRFDSLALNVPGIRLPSSSQDDQARVGTPGGTLEAGATRLVIGRDLTSNPAENWDKIVGHILASKEA